MSQQMFGIPGRFIPPGALPPAVAKRLERLTAVGGGAYIDPGDYSLRVVDSDRFGKRVELAHYRWDTATRLFFPYVNHNGTWKACKCSAVPWRWYAAQNYEETMFPGEWHEIQANMGEWMLLRPKNWPLTPGTPVWVPVGSGLSLPALADVLGWIRSPNYPNRDPGAWKRSWLKLAEDLHFKYGDEMGEPLGVVGVPTQG